MDCNMDDVVLLCEEQAVMLDVRKMGATGKIFPRNMKIPSVFVILPYNFFNFASIWYYP